MKALVRCSMSVHVHFAIAKIGAVTMPNCETQVGRSIFHHSN